MRRSHRSRRHRRVSRLTRTAIAFAFSTLLAAGSSPAQTRPTSHLYQGPQCFSTVVSGIESAAGRVTGSGVAGKQVFSAGESVFVESEAGALVVDGEYLLYRIEGQIVHPSTGETVGTSVALLGRARVTDVQANRAVADIESACAEIELGDGLHAMLGREVATDVEVPAFAVSRLFEARPEDAVVVYGVSDSLYDATSATGRRDMTVRNAYASGDVVTLDQGRAQGYRTGSIVTFYLPPHGPTAMGEEAQSEATVLAQGFVLWLEDSTAAVLITDSDRVVEIGARARVER